MTSSAVLALLVVTVAAVVVMISRLTGISIRCLFAGCTNRRMYFMVRHRRCVRCDRVTIGDAPR